MLIRLEGGVMIDPDEIVFVEFSLHDRQGSEKRGYHVWLRGIEDAFVLSEEQFEEAMKYYRKAD